MRSEIEALGRIGDPILDECNRDATSAVLAADQELPQCTAQSSVRRDVPTQTRETDWDERDKQLRWADRWFINHHDPRDLTTVDRVIAKLAVAGYHEPSVVDARRRITAFFRRHVVTNDE